MFFKYKTDNRTRGHSWALAKERCKLDIRKYAFSQRTINEWNRLPWECVNATSVIMFKNKIDNYFKSLDVGYEYNRTLDKPLASLYCAILGSQHNWDLAIQLRIENTRSSQRIVLWPTRHFRIRCSDCQ